MEYSVCRTDGGWGGSGRETTNWFESDREGAACHKEGLSAIYGHFEKTRQDSLVLEFSWGPSSRVGQKLWPRKCSRTKIFDGVLKKDYFSIPQKINIDGERHWPQKQKDYQNHALNHNAFLNILINMVSRIIFGLLLVGPYCLNKIGQYSKSISSKTRFKKI